MATADPKTDPSADTVDAEAMAATAVPDALATDPTLAPASLDGTEAGATAWDTTVDEGCYVDRRILTAGGMGRITVARDRRLGRRVAIKELRRSTPALRARFEREALLTARLEHPGIVGIHEAGRWPDGEPFFAMRLVPGRSLDEVLTGAKSAAARLALVPNVIAMAEAIGYAHEQRVIHRDLKPHNVMIGEFGETVVIDWGLAKDLGAADDEAVADEPTAVAASGETAHGSVLGTPAYMPPEQARGVAVDERADVYAIGAVLYHVLGGAPPYAMDVSDRVLAAVLAAPPEPLATRAPGLPDDLVAIVERAMARTPAGRYRTGRELADDLRRFQTGQLVGAHRYSMGALVRRWLRRYRAPVAVGAGALVVLAVLGTLAIRRVVDERATAQRERALAETRHHSAEQLAEFMLTNLRDRLIALDRLDLLDPLATATVDYYDRAARRGEPRTEGEIYAHRLLAETRLFQGDLSTAGRELAMVRDQLADEVAAKPGDPLLRRQLAVAHESLGDVAVGRGDGDGALAEYQQGVTILDALLAASPDDATWLRDDAEAHQKIGTVSASHGDSQRALAEYQAAQALVQRTADALPGDVEANANLGRALVLTGGALLDGGDSAGALVALTKARDLAAAVAKADDSGRRSRELYVALDQLGRAQRARGDSAAARTSFEDALAIAERLAARDPGNAIWQRDATVALTALGELEHDGGDLDAALARFQRALAVREALAARDPSNVAWQTDLAIAIERVGAIAYERKQTADAEAGFRRALAIREQVAARDPADGDLARGVAVARSKLVKTLRASGDLPGAAVEARAVLASFDRLATADPTNRSKQRDLSYAHHELGSLLAQQGDFAGARRELAADLAIAERLAAAEPDNLGRADDVADSLEMIAKVVNADGDPAGARATYARALAIREHDVAAQPANDRFVKQLEDLKATIAGCCKGRAPR